MSEGVMSVLRNVFGISQNETMGVSSPTSPSSYFTSWMQNDDNPTPSPLTSPSPSPSSSPFLKSKNVPGLVVEVRSEPKENTNGEQTHVNNTHIEGTSVRENYESNSSPISSPNRVTKSPQHHIDPRLQKFKSLLSSQNVNMEELRKLGWNGIPLNYKADCWKLLLGYMPPVRERREATMNAKRQQYWDCVHRYITTVEDADRAEFERQIYYQISIDVPRTCPDVNFCQTQEIQMALQRILYIWAIRHPASGYVQGINDLVTPFLAVFLLPHMNYTFEGAEYLYNINEIPSEILKDVEADAYWCLTKFIDSIQDNYTFAQPGIQRMVYKLKEITSKLDTPLNKYFEKQNTEYLQFAFRWMNCLLMREFPLRLVIRIWDTYLSEGESFSSLHVYLCSAFLLKWSKKIQECENQDMLMLLQKLPTDDWEDKDVETLLSQAYVWKIQYNDAPGHLKT